MALKHMHIGIAICPFYWRIENSRLTKGFGFRFGPLLIAVRPW
jgi:hypothetical protein